MIKPRFSASITTMFREFDLLDRFAAARRAGFDGVEIQDLAEADPAAMARAARDADMPAVLINVDMGDFRQGGDGLSGVPGRESEFADAFDRALDAAEGFGARFIHLGPSRVPDGVGRDACLDAYRRNLARALDQAAGRAPGAVLLAEAINAVDFPTVLISNLETATEAMAGAPEARTGLLFDVYHLAMGGRDLAEQFQAHRQRVRHVQFSNLPGRNEPDIGKLDFAVLFERLATLGYQGWFGAEYTPRRPTLETLAWLANYRGPLSR